MKTPDTERAAPVCVPAGIRLAASPGSEKEQKLLNAVRKLPGNGIVVAPDHEYVRHICETLDSAAVRFVATHIHEQAEDDLSAVRNFGTGAYKLLVIDQAAAAAGPAVSARFVIHWSPPETLEQYALSVTALCRPGGESFALLFYEQNDRWYHEHALKNLYGEDQRRLLDRLRPLGAVEEYVRTGECRVSALNRLRGIDPPGESCGCCDNCRKRAAERELAAVDRGRAVTALHCAWELREKFGVHLLTDVLRGSRSKRIETWGLRNARSFGALRSDPRKEILALFARLTELGCIRKTGGTFPTVYLTSSGKDLIAGTEPDQIELPKRMTVKPGEIIDYALFEKIRNFRRETARRLNLPAFMLFPDRVLKGIVLAKPLDRKALTGVRGFGKTAWNLCGEELLKLLRDYCAKEM